MGTFLEETIETILHSYENVSDTCIILPSKRAGGFLRNYLRRNASKTFFAPKIISIEQFIEELSDLRIVDQTELLFKSYEAYKNTSTIVEKDDFDVYATWATILLGDFNEIDRYLIPPKEFFSYLEGIQNINHWYLKEEKTPLIQNYLKFWNSLYDFYSNLKELLLKEQVAYQGLVYRQAADAIEHYIAGNSDKKHVFIGFNALNTSEQTIIQELLETGNTEVYWDADVHFHKDPQHSASYFLRKYMSEWNYFKENPPKHITPHFEKSKTFRLIEVQKNVGQAKYVGEILANLSEEELNNTAVVLADEQLLIPILHSLPENVEKVNITMGVSLRTFPAVVLFEKLLAFHTRYSKRLYYKDVVSILDQPLCQSALPSAKNITSYIHKENLTYMDLTVLLELAKEEEKEMFKWLFDDWEGNSAVALTTCLQIVLKLKEVTRNDVMQRSVLYELFQVFRKIEVINQRYSYLHTVKTVKTLFSELSGSHTLDLKGDAYNGLQIMGVLETRVLNFDHVIMTSVNEGILPSGKSNNSYITYDLKQQFGLPLFSEKDAVYTYHFYRLLHRAQRVSLIYSSASEALNTGEKSRYLMQLEIEKQPNHQLEHLVVSPELSLKPIRGKNIEKTSAIMKRIKEVASQGFSPSALTSYIRNPIDFYYQKILRINEYQEVEETVAANTLGTIVHDTLENLYSPLEGSILSSEVLLDMKKGLDIEVRTQFEKTFRKGSFTEGKNLLIFEVAKRYIVNFINFELSEIKEGNQIKILKIESNLAARISIPELDFPVKIHGKIDRLDEYNGQLRVIDYKTGMVNQAELEVMDWTVITKDAKHSKSMQVLAYALMIHQERRISRAEAGIISFKNLKSGFLKFGTKEKPRGPKDHIITPEVLETYSNELKRLIVEICNPQISFEEKELTK